MFRAEAVTSARHSSRRRTSMLLLTLFAVLCATSCSGSGVNSARTNEVTMAFLRGDATLEELATAITLTEHRSMSIAEAHGRAVVLSDGHDRVVGEGGVPPEVPPPPSGQYELSLEGLARFYSAHEAAGTYGAIDRLTPEFYSPTWFYYERFFFQYSLKSLSSDHVNFLRDMSFAVGDFVATTRLGLLEFIHVSLFPDILCLRSTKIDMNGLLGELVRTLDDVSFWFYGDVASHPEVLRRAELAGLNAESVEEHLSDCFSGDTLQLFDLPYDFDEVRKWLQDQIHTFLIKWIEQDGEWQPEDLVFVD